MWRGLLAAQLAPVRLPGPAQAAHKNTFPVGLEAHKHCTTHYEMRDGAYHTVDQEGHLIVNDLVNRALKVFRIGEDTPEYVTGELVLKKYPEVGGLRMPFFIYAYNLRAYEPDNTLNFLHTSANHLG